MIMYLLLLFLAFIIYNILSYIILLIKSFIGLAVCIGIVYFIFTYNLSFVEYLNKHLGFDVVLTSSEITTQILNKLKSIYSWFNYANISKVIDAFKN